MLKVTMQENDSEAKKFEQLENGDLVKDHTGNIFITIKYGYDVGTHGLYCLQESNGSSFGVFCQAKNLGIHYFTKLNKGTNIILNNT